ncbi:MAG: LuxR C-terminal-related transcriptional regulator [Chloroflexales bacterium]
MAYQILATKLYNPPIQSHFVQRAALVQRLEKGVQQGKRITLVSAPAGFGKTTLISAWMASRDPYKPFGWVSLDDGDNDPVRFLIYVVAAIQKVNPDIGQTILATLQSPQPPPLSELVGSLINEIVSKADFLLIVLDDYHLVKNKEVHALIQLLFERQPAFMHTVIMTREDPPLPLPKMRVLGHVTEVRERDLRFTTGEAESFFKQTMGLDLERQAVAVLGDHTEGWVAGLQLAAIALQEYADSASVQGFINAFAGNDRYIVDYLGSEVLLHLSESVRRFLLVTSILERMCGPLCDAVLGEGAEPGSSQNVLDDLERANMFIIPLDNRRQWYRYHHLFAELLQHTGHTTPSIHLPELHRRASAWHERHGLLQEAVHHAFMSQDWTYAAELVERHAMDLIGQSQLGWLQDWIGRFPEPIIQSRPGLGIFHAWVLMLSFRTDYRLVVNEKLQQAEQALNASEHPPLAALGPGGALVPLRAWVTGHVCAVRSQLLLAAFNEPIDPHEVIRLSVQSLDLLPPVEKTIRSTCSVTIAHGYLMLGDIGEAKKAFAESLQMALEAGNYFSAVTALFYQARVAYHTGQMDRAFEICREGLANLTPRFHNPEQDLPAIRSLYVMQGVVLLEWNQLADAERLLDLATNRVGYAPWVEIIAYEALVRLWDVRGDAANVIAILNRMDTMGPQIASCAEALRVHHLISHAPQDARAREAARTWAETHAPNRDTVTVLHGIGPYQVDAEYMVFRSWLQIQNAIRNYQDVLAALSDVLAAAEAKGFVQRVSELARIKAVALREGGADTRALEVHAHAPTHAQPAGVRDPLSERELDVLRLLACGLTLAEVAERLCLSPHTVKAHTQSIYSKLDVHSRVEAANTARELGLI